MLYFTNEERILAMLEQMQGQVNRLETKMDNIDSKINHLETKMDEGFERLEYSINIAGKDIAKLEKRLLAHEAKPIH